MALKHREELVGKRFLSVSCTAKLKVTKIIEWEWRAGIVRAASHKDPKHPDLTVLVEFDDLDWKRREWIKVYDEELFLVFLVEHTLIWAPREDNPIRGGAKNLYWPAVNFKPLVDKVGLKEQNRKPIEYLVDRKLNFTEYVNLKVYQEHDNEKQSASRDYPEVRKAIKQWTEYQDGQKILLTTPSVLVGYRVEVYRVEGTTQWYTAVIVSYNDNTRELTLTDDTVLEEHNEDPCLVQMKLIGDGVVESILKGENIGITPRRRACTQQRVAVPYSTRTRNQQQSPTALPIRITSAAIPTIQRKSRYRQGAEENLLDSTIDKVSGLGSESPNDCKRPSVENCSVIRLLPLPSNNKRRTTQKIEKKKDDVSDDDIDEPLSSLLNSRKAADLSTDSSRDEDSSDQEDSLKNHKKSHRKQSQPKRVNSLQEEDSADEDAKSHSGSSAVSPTNAGDVASQDNGAMSQIERPLLEDSAKVDNKAVGGPKSPAADSKADLTKRVGRNGSPIDIRKVESAKSSSPLVFCDPGLVNSKRQFDPLHQPSGLMHPAGLTHTATAAYPRVPNIGQHARPPMHMGHYGLSSPLMPSQHMSPAPGSAMEQSSIHPQAYRQLLSQHPLLPAQYGSHVGLGMLWQQKFPAMTTPSPNHWMMDMQYMERERALAARLDRERREEQERMERDRLEREKAEKEMERERQEKERREREKAERERLERERQERERLEREERERVQREAVQQHFEESLARLANEKVKWKTSWNQLLKPLPTANMGRCSPVVTVHSHSIHSAEIEKDKREKIAMETKERHNNVDRGRQDQERWMALVQQRNEQAADLSHSQNFALVEQRQGNAHSKMEGYTVSRSSPHPSIVTSSIASKSGVNSSPIIATSTAATAQSKPEASFSLYGYQPFQHTYITQAQLKAREESKATVNQNNQMVPVSRQPNQQSSHSREKEASIPFERSATPGNSRTSTPGSQPSSNKQQLKVMRSMGSEHTSPVYQPAVGGNGAFRPYEYTSQSPAPAHQNTSSPGLGTRIGTPHFHRASPQQEQPQNLVKGEPTEGSVAQHLPYQRYESSRSAASSSPSMQAAGYGSPYGAIKNNVPATSSPHSYNLIQQGVVPNPLYTPASSGGPTTAPPCVTTVTQISHQTTSPPLGQTYPRATSGMGITSGTPVCRSNVYSVTQGRMSYTHSSNSNIQPGMSPGRTSTPHETSGRSNVLMPGQCHKSPSPAHMHSLSMSHGNNSTPPPPTGSRVLPPSTSPRPNSTQGTVLFTRAALSQQPMHSSSPHSITLSATGSDGQPLNLQNNGSSKRKPVRDGSSRKRQKASEDQLMPPQLQPQYHIPPATMPSSRETSPISQTASIAQHSMSQNSSFTITASEAPTLSPHTMVSPSPIPPSGLESHHSEQNQTYDELLKIKQKVIGIPPSSSPISHSKRSDTPPKLSNCATASSPVSLNNLSMPPVLVGATAVVSESVEEKVIPSSAQFTSNSSVNTNSITTTGSTNHTKLKKAWLQRHSENEDKRNPTERINADVANPPNNGSTVISTENSTSSITEKVSNTNTKETKSSDKVLVNENSKTEGAKVPDDSTSSASETELELKNLKRKTRVGRKQPTTNSISAGSKRQKIVSESSATDTSTGITTRKDDAKKKASPPEKEVNSRRRGRKTKARAVVALLPPPVPDDVKKKSVVMKGGKNSNLPSPAKPFEKPSVAQLKRTGESFLQDGPCYVMAPKLPKCRECRMTPHQRNKKMPNIFCRFYAFRKLRYGKNGSIVSAGFSEPSDATEQDLKLWLPPVDCPPPEIDVDTAKYLLSTMGGQFCELVEQEKEAQRLHMSNDTTITWKRVLQGVRELCDVCDTTLFNIHWVCHKCGFVVCIDCYKARKNGNGKETSLKDRDMYQWLLCSNKQPHEQEKLTMTQIIARSALWDVGKALHEIHRKWNISFSCRCNNKIVEGEIKDVKHSTNGICKQLMSAVTKCLTDKDRVQVNGSPRGKKRNSNGMSGVIKQEDGYSSESGSSPLSWLADVALNSSGKLSDEKGGQIKMKSELDDDDDDRKPSISQLAGFEDGSHDEDDSNENFSTLRELLIRPAGKGGNGNRSNRNSVSNVKTTLSGLISNIVEQRVKKLDKDGKHPTHYTRRHSRECDPLRVCNLAESLILQSDVPHLWLCKGKLLLLRDSEHEDNIKLFQEQWKLGEPIVVAGVGKKLDLGLWQPENLCQEFGDIKNDIINCKTGAVLPNIPMRKFWEGFENVNKRMKDDDGEHMLLKSKWPMGDDFSELSPVRFQDLMSVLPLPQYTLREGILNLASHLPACFVHPDLGPKIFNAYGSLQHATKGTINLHLEMSDSVNVMVYVGMPKEAKEDERSHDIVKTYDEVGCDQVMKKRLKEKGAKPGALWHIYHADDADKINNFLLKVAKERGQESIRNPLVDQSWYLDEELRDRLSEECSIESYAVVQCLGDAIFIPAGAPHQVRNLHSCIKVSEDFVSPENVAQCFNLIQQSQQASDTNISHEDKLQIKNLIYHAVKNALAQLQASDPEDYQT